MTQAFNLSQLANGVDTSGKLDLSTNSKNPSWTTDIVANGLTVGKGAGSVATNTAVGASALAGNSTGAGITAVGYGAATATTASWNTAVGYTALNASNSGVGNVAVGADVMNNNTTGICNTAVGSYDGTTLGALRTNTTGSYNIAIGTGSLKSNTTASNNTAVGYQALYSNTVANNSVAIGHQAGYSYVGTSGGNNVLVGQAAGYALTTGSGNTFIGSSITTAGSGAAITTGTKNTIIGGYSGNQGGLDIRTASNYIVLSDGDGNPRGIFDGSGNLFVGGVSQVASGQVSITYDTNHQGMAFKPAGNNTTFVLFKNASSTDIGSISTSGGSITLYNTTSDYRLKTVVGPVSGAGERIDALEPIEYTWNFDGSQTRGFLAHKFQEVYAGSVSGTKDAVNEDGSPMYQSMQAGSSEVIADLVSEIQSLRQRVAQLESN